MNGVLVAPSHTLKNAEVVQIVMYDKSPSVLRSIQLHKQFLKVCTSSDEHQLRAR